MNLMHKVFLCRLHGEPDVGNNIMASKVSLLDLSMTTPYYGD